MRYRCPICSFEFIGGGFCPSPYHVATMMEELPEQEDNREMKNFIAYSAQIDEQEFFETHEEALEWLKKSDLEGADEGFSLEACEGGSFIAKITHRSQYIEDDNKENYCQCEDENCENEHWDYSHDSVGHIEYKEVSHGDKCHVKLGPECPPECKRNEPTLRGVCDLTINNCDGCDNKTGTPCKVTFDLYKCAKRKLGDLIADGNYVAAIELYNQIREKISNESKNNVVKEKQDENKS